MQMGPKFVQILLSVMAVVASINSTPFDVAFSQTVAPLQSSCDDEQRSLVDTLVKLTVVLGMLDRHNEAGVELKKLSNHEQHMDTIVHQLYARNRTNINRTLSILWETSCVGVAKGVSVLFEEMKTQGHLSEPEVLVFYKFLQNIGCEEHVKLTNFMIEHYTDQILNLWTEDIIAGNYSHIYNFSGESASNYAAVLPHVPELLRRGLSDNITSFHTILQFINDCPYLGIKAAGYLALAQELKKYNLEHSANMLLVGYWVDSTIKNNSQALNENKALNEEFEKVKAEIPLITRNIFWKSTCTIKNLYWVEYMYATNESVEANGAVFTWMTGNKPRAAKWVLESKYTEGKLSFVIENEQLSNESSSNATFNLCQVATSPKVVTCGGIANSWILEPTTISTVRWNGDAFKIKNFHVGEHYLSQEKSEYHLGLKRREVRVSAVLGVSSYWEIECS